jgi:hypothetical protein
MATDNPAFQAQVGALTKQLVDGGLGTYQAKRQAYARLYLMVRNQASTLAYVDTFWFLALCAALMFGLWLLLQRNDPAGSRDGQAVRRHQPVAGPGAIARGRRNRE